MNDLIYLNHRGRINLITDEKEITGQNLISVLQGVWGDHLKNEVDCDTLINFEAGDQPLGRTKTYRSDIDWNITFNLAAYITDFKVGFHWGNPITLVQRGNDNNRVESDAIQQLNEHYAMSGDEKDTQELARFVEITGIGYTFVDINTEWEEGDSFFTRNVLDPRRAFVVKSNYYPDKRPVLGVAYRLDRHKVLHFTCFTKDERFELTSNELLTLSTLKHGDRSGEPNPLGKIPIIEWIRSYDRQGCFERQLDELVKLNLLESDAANAIDQNVLAVWHANDVEFPKEVIKNEDGTTTERIAKPSSGDWIETYTTPEGKQPFIKPLTIDYGLQGILQEKNTLKTSILTNCHVPQRNDNSGGSTGIAMDDASGWTDAEIIASAQERITDGCKMEELKVVLSAIRESDLPSVEPDNPMLRLKAWDMQPNQRRPKAYELTVRANATATLLSHGFALEDVMTSIPLFPDPAQVILRSGDGVKKYQETIWQKKHEGEGGEGETAPNADRIMQDPSDQVMNSPSLRNE